jgi:tetratricopeptide (TPR) repeat protein
VPARASASRADDLWTPEPTRGGGGFGRRGKLALAGLAALALLVALAVAFSGAGGETDPATSDRAAETTQDEPSSSSSPGDEGSSTAESDPGPQAGEEPAEPATPTPPADTAPDNEGEGGAGPSASGESPRALNDEGFAKLQAGDAAGAVTPLQQAVAGFEEQGDSADATQYGFALYNLGEALRQSGRPGEAIPYYERRLQVNPSDRPEVVRASLEKARAAAGQTD